jgi:predicted acetyltransferase
MMFTVKAVENDAELFAAHELVSLAFHGGVDTEGIIASMAYWKQHPAFQYDQHRIGVLDGKAIANVIAVPYTLRYGEAELTFGGIGAVCTHPDHRMKGYAAAVMRNTVEYMRARGDHFSMLNTGEVGFYPKFGYHTLWSDGTVEIEAANALTLSNSLRLRSASAEDIPQMTALFDRNMAQRVTMLRSRELWAWRMAAESDAYPRVVEVAGQIAGYWVGFYGNHLIEMVADSDEAVAALLADAARIFQDTGPEKISILVLPDEALLHRIRRMVPCEMMREFVPGANWMARIIDTEGFRDAVLPEIKRQAGPDVRLNIQPNSVMCGQGSISTELDHATFLQVLFGILPPAILPLQAETINLLERVFPRRDFIISPWDWF